MKQRAGKKQSSLAVAANEIWRKKNTLSVVEQRLLLWGISQTKANDSEFAPITLTVAEYAKLTGVSSGNLHHQMQEVVAGQHGIMSRVIVIPDIQGGWKAFNWLLRAEYANGVMKLTLHPDLAPYVLHLKERFTAVPLLPVMRFRSNYAIAFFEYCCSWQRSNKMAWEMSVAELRDWLHIEPGTMEMIGHIRTRVIEQAKKELDQKAPLTFEYEPKKQGRAILGWRFRVIENIPSAQAKTRGTKDAELPPNESSDLEQRLNSARYAWQAATEEQRAAWLKAMPSAPLLAPKKEGDKVGPLFLKALSEVIEPELPLSWP